jgi:hypothetical protein
MALRAEAEKMPALEVNAVVILSHGITPAKGHGRDARATL